MAFIGVTIDKRTNAAKRYLYIFDPDDDEELLPSLPNALPHVLRWSPDGKKLLFIEKEDLLTVVKLFDMETGSAQELIKLEFHQTNIRFWGWSPDQKWALFTVLDRSPPTILLLDVANGTTKTVGQGGPPKWAPDSSALFYSSKTGWTKVDPSTMRSEKLSSPRESKLFRDSRSSWQCCWFFPQFDAFLLRQGSWDGSDYRILIPADGGEEKLLIEIHHPEEFWCQVSVEGILPSPDGELLLVTAWSTEKEKTSDNTGTALDQGWSTFVIDNSKLPFIITNTDTCINNLYGFAWSPDGTSFIAHAGLSAKIIDARSGEQYKEFLYSQIVPDTRFEITPYHSGIYGLDIVWLEKP